MKGMFTILALVLAGCSQAVIQGPAGPAGAVGATGPSGPQGAAGVSCTGQNVAAGDSVLPYGGTIITCANGAPGADGAPAPVTPHTIAEVIDPCGNTSAFHEVFLRLTDGVVIASFSDNTNGSWTRLSELLDGYNLMTTDHTGCTFDLTTTGTTRTIHWHSGGTESWTIQ